MSSIEKMGAMESMFDPEETTASLLEAVKTNVANTVKTVDEAASLENKLSEEAAQFNACLTTMSNAIRKCERGEISREEMLAECAPCVAALKEKCAALKLADVKTTGDDITEDEIAMLREYIVGCKDIVADRKRELQDCPVACASEGLLAGLANFEPATEANMYKEIRKSTEAKTANELYKQAKKLYGLGSKEKALEYLKSAQKKYENCLAKAKEAGKTYEVERTAKNRVGSYSQQDKFTREVTDSYDFAYLIEYFEDRIDSCKALEMQWNNKAGKSTYKETKAQLRAERKETRKQMREERKAARAAKKAEKAEGGNEEAVEALGMAEDEFIDAMEAMMDSIELEISLDAAMEAEGEEAEAPKAGGIFARIRGGLSKMRKSEKPAERKEAAEEVKEAAKELEEAADAAETPEEKKRLSNAAKGGLAAMGAALIAAGLYAAGKACKAAAEKKGQDPKAVAKLLVKYADALDKSGNAAKTAVKDAIQNAGDAAASRRVGKAEQSAVKAEEDKERANRFLVNQAEKAREKAKKTADKEFAKYQKNKANESFLSSLAFGLEGVMVNDEDVDDDKVEPMEGKAFDDEDLIEEATEAAIAVMMAEDGIDDSDIE